MKSLVIIFIWFPLCHSTDIPDVTAIYHVAKNSSDNYVDIHLRTDALALPVALGDQLFGPQDVEFQLHSHNLNEWEHKNWTLVTANWLLYNYVDIHLQTDALALPVAVGDQLFDPSIKNKEFHEFHGGLHINFKSILPCQNFKLILTTDDTPLRQQRDFYHIYFSDYHYSGLNIDKCTYNSYQYNSHKIIGGYNFWCTELKSFSQSNSDYSLRITQVNGVLNVWPQNFNSEPLFSWNYENRIQFYRIIYDERFLYYIEIAPLVQIRNTFLKTNKEATVISPPFTPKYKNLCLAVIFYTEENTVLKSMDVYVEDMLLNRVFLGSFGKSLHEQAEAHWHTKKLFTRWPDSINSTKIRLLIDISVERGSYRLERITSCNAEYDENVIVLRKNAVVPFTHISIPMLRGNDDEDNGSSPVIEREQCQHGSVYIQNQCGCPPGFVGLTCKKGCGQNRFGKDCKGKCSIHPSGCSGLIMCTPFAGCSCAPGYKGSTCEEICNNGTYGNNCANKCGNSKDGVCNIYTGECSSCLPGYQMPLCQKKYDYTIQAPEVDTTTLGEVIVTADLSTTYNANPLFYTIQYKKQFIFEPWTSYNTYPIPSNRITQPTVVKGLDHGIQYIVRIVLTDADFNSYQGPDIPAANFISLCIIPESPEYHVDVVASQTAFTVSWKYVLKNIYWCPVEKFEIHWTGGWNWITDFTNKTEYTVSNLLPGTSIKFKVRTITKSGSAPFSSVAEFSTKSSTISEQVQDLKVETTTSKNARISWNPPFGLEAEPLTYVVNYECLKQVACQKQCAESSGELLVTETIAYLEFLYPTSQYLVSVSAEGGPKRSILVGTKMTAPQEVPELSTKLPVRTNTSVTVFWNAVEVCSGFFSNYIYQIYKAGDTKLIQNGLTRKTSAKFENLRASTGYKVLVYIQTSFDGNNYDKYLEMNVSTSATVPDQVQNLTVYKRGRHMLGVRWASPINSYGPISSFTVKYGLGENASYKTETIKPSPCVVWPHLFCHTITQLQADRMYTIVVSARNSEVDADGNPTEIKVISKEKTPGPPENIKLVNSTSNSFSIQWDYPWMANGIIRTFLMSIEETEQFEEENCCQVYPLFETTVTEELEHYVTEVSGVRPASTYVVSVSSKTVVFGPSQAITIHTRPPPLPIFKFPTIHVKAQDNVTWWPQLPQFINNTEIYRPLVKGLLILVVSNDTEFNYTGLQSEELNKEVKSVIPGNFYATAEYMGEESEIQLGTNETVDSKWGKIHNAALQESMTYQLAVVQVTEYCGVYNLDIIWSAPFIAS